MLSRLLPIAAAMLALFESAAPAAMLTQNGYITTTAGLYLDPIDGLYKSPYDIGSSLIPGETVQVEGFAGDDQGSVYGAGIIGKNLLNTGSGIPLMRMSVRASNSVPRDFGGANWAQASVYGDWYDIVYRNSVDSSGLIYVTINVEGNFYFSDAFSENLVDYVVGGGAVVGVGGFDSIPTDRAIPLDRSPVGSARTSALPIIQLSRDQSGWGTFVGPFRSGARMDVITELNPSLDQFGGLRGISSYNFTFAIPYNAELGGYGLGVYGAVGVIARNGFGGVDFGNTFEIAAIYDQDGTRLDWNELRFDSGLRFNPSSASPVPEPSSLALLVSGGAVGVVRFARRRRTRARLVEALSP
jgi:PEP-CTERM motif